MSADNIALKVQDLDRMVDALVSERLDPVSREEVRPLIDMSKEDLQKEVAALILTLSEFIRRLMEAQVLRRMDRGTLNDDEIDRLGEALMSAREAIDQLREQFDLEESDLNLDLGPLGRLL